MGATLKEQTAEKAARAIIRLLPNLSDDNLIRLLSLGKRMSDDSSILHAIDKIERLFQTPGNPTKALFRRVIKYLPAHRRIRLFETLFNGAWFEGGKLRYSWEARKGFRPPFMMILSPTLRCNLRCKGCYTLGYGMKPELPLDVADRVVSEAEALGIRFVTILGGEPRVYPPLFALLEKHPSVFFQVYSNGTLMTRETAQRFADLGNTAVVLSIEGGEKETDSWRGQGVYRKIMEAFEYLHDARVIIGTSATVTSQNVDIVSSLEFVDHMISLGSVAQMYFMYIPVNGSANFALMLTPHQRDHLRRQVLAMRDTRPLFVLDFWNDGPYVDGCIAGGRRYFHINAKGDVEPCVFTHIALDNVYDTPLAEALNSSLFCSIRGRQPHNPNHLRPCMIVDNPHVMREVIQETNARFTHPGAEEIYTVKKEEIDAYAAKWGRLADAVWEKDYLNQAKAQEEKTDELSLAKVASMSNRSGVAKLQLS
jgi:MoaA/NifB/PqqE/SkfB family radical SAM enzyme